MRIVQLNPYHYPYMGGIEHRLHEVARRLSPRHEVIVLTSRLPGTKEEEVIDNYMVRRLPSTYINLYNPPYVQTTGILDTLRDLDPDLVDFHYRWAPTYTKAMRRYEGRWVFTFHNTFGEGSGPLRALSIINDAIFCRWIRDRRVICVTRFIKDDLRSRGFRDNLLEVVPTGVEVARTVPSEGDFVLYIGRLVGTKGLRYLLEAMKWVDSRLIICGSGPEMGRLEDLAYRLKMGGKVKFTGQVDEATKESLMSSCKLLVMPSLYESLGLASVEAMAYGKPVVASAVGGLPEVVGEGGITVPPRDPRLLAQAINRLLNDDALRAEKGRRARNQAQRYSWESIIKELERIYLRAANE